MAVVRIKVEGLNEILAGFDGMPDAFAGELKAGLLQGAELVADIAKGRIERASGSGELRKGKRASAPGEPPVNRTGKLVNAIKAKPGTGNGIEAFIEVDHPAALTFEFGSKRIEARPFIRPAAEISRGVFEQILADAAQRGAKKIGK